MAPQKRLTKNQVKIGRDELTYKEFVVTINMEEVLEQIKDQIRELTDQGFYDNPEETEFHIYNVLAEEEVKA